MPRRLVHLALITILCSANDQVVGAKTSSKLSAVNEYIGPCKATGVCTYFDEDVDVVIGGMLPIRGQQDALSCGGKLTTGSLLFWQGAEMIRWVVDIVNANPTQLKGVRLGYHIRDTCSSSRVALKEALSFISFEQCATGNGQATTSASSLFRPTVGIVGAAYSSISQPLTDLLRLFDIPLVSPASTSAALDDKSRYPLFFRTIQSDAFQAKALVALAVKNGWRYVSVVHSTDSYGTYGARTFRDEALKCGVCIAYEIGVHPVKSRLHETEKARDKSYRESVQGVLKGIDEKAREHRRTGETYSRVVLLWMVGPEAKHWLQFANDSLQFRQRNITVLASEGWSTDSQAIKDLPVVLGGVGAFPKGSRAKLAVNHLDQMKLSQPGRNPWLERVYSGIYNCNASSPCRNLSLGALHSDRSAHGRRLASSSDGTSAYLAYVIDAAFALAHAVSASIDELCIPLKNCTTSNRKNLARQSLATSDGRQVFLKNLRAVDFINPVTDHHVAFTAKGNPAQTDYIFTNVQRKQLQTSNSVLEWIAQVAVYHPSENTSRRNIPCPSNIATFVELHKPIVYAGGSHKPPVSICSQPCHTRQIARVYLEQKPFDIRGGQPVQCCWRCKTCRDNQYVGEAFGSCLACPATAQHNHSGEGCVAISVWMWSNDLTMVKVYSGLALAMMSGILFVCFLLQCRLQEDMKILPLGGDLATIGLSTIALSCCFIFPLSIKPSSVSCGFAHLVWSVAVTVPFIPNLVYIASLLAVITVLPQLGISSVHAVHGLWDSSTHQAQKAATFPSRKLVSPSSKQQPGMLLVDVCYLMSTSRKRCLAALVLSCVLVLVLLVISLVTNTSPVEEIKPHTHRRLWCSTSPVLSLAVYILAFILVSTAVLALVASHRMKQANFDVLFTGIRFVLSNATRSVITVVIIGGASLSIWKALDGVDKQMSALVIATFALLATNFLTTYAVLLYHTWSRRRKSFSVSQQVLMDELVCAALGTIKTYTFYTDELESGEDVLEN